MDIAVGTWFKYLREGARNTEKEVVTEISRREARDLYDWMAQQDEQINPEFDELLNGKMRVSFPLASSEERKLVQIVNALKEEGWEPPPSSVPNKPMFPHKIVKQKGKRRVGLLADYPDFVPPPHPETNPDPRPVEEYYEDKTVAELNLEKTYDFTIPAGPRKGENIKKTDKSSMSRAIAKLLKEKKIAPELVDWWAKKQTFYTKEMEWENIEEMFVGTHLAGKSSVIISRHPMDVLRMSDIGRISSCHREGGEYFQCAVAESRGTGLVSYIVNTDDLEDFLRIKPDEQDTYPDAAWSPKFHHAQRMVKNHILKNKKVFDSLHEHLNDAHMFEFGVNAVVQNWGSVSREVKAAVTYDMVREAIRATLDKKPWPPLDQKLPPPNPIGDFDKMEIFRDPNRDIPGIVADSRLRLRKFYDSASDNWFAAPEERPYGARSPGFVGVVRDWAWDNQKYMFVDEENNEMQLPRFDNLVRFGASYEDTSDGELLNDFFSMSGTRIQKYHGNVEHDSSVEEGNLYEEYEEQVSDLLQSAENRAMHVSVSADVDDQGDGHPYVWARAGVRFEFELGWEGAPLIGDDGTSAPYDFPKEKRKFVVIPSSWGGPYAERREFEQRVDSVMEDYMYPDETLWEVDLLKDDPRATLSVEFTFTCEDCSEPNDLDNFIDYMLGDVDENYDEIYEKMRRKLVLDDYVAPNDFDRLFDDLQEANEELEHWRAHGVDEDDDYDGEVWFWFEPYKKGELDPPLGISFPKSIGNTPFAVEKIFPDASVDRGAGGHLNPGIRFRQYFAHALLGLQEAANGYAQEQMELDFGEKYARPTFEGVDLSQNSQIRFTIDRENEIRMILKIIIEATDSTEEVEGALTFMRYIDQYPMMIMDAARSAFKGFMENYQERQKIREREYMDGTKMEVLYRGVSSKYGVQADGGDPYAEGAMLAAMWVRDNWEKMTLYEKYAAIDRLLRPLALGSLHPRHAWDVDKDWPLRWDTIVRTEMRERGASQSQIDARLKEIGSDLDYWGVHQGEPIRATLNEPVPAGGAPGEVHYVSDDVAPDLMRARMGLSPAEAQGASLILYGPTLSDEERFKAMGALVAGDKEEFMRIIGNRDVRQLARGGDRPMEEQIEMIDKMLREEEGARSGREPIDLRIYRVNLGCIVDLDIAGTDSQIENQIRGIEEVTTVRHMSVLQKRVAARHIFRVYEIKFELYGQQARDQFRDLKLVPDIAKQVKGVKVVDRGQVQDVDNPLREWAGLGRGYGMPPRGAPEMVTPSVGIESVLEDWTDGGVQIYDTPMNTNQMQYHVMMLVEDLWQYCSRYYRGSKTDFDGRYKYFIKDGAQMPVYVALGQNGRAKITGNEDLIWFAKKAGVKELPVFFSYQKQV